MEAISGQLSAMRERKMAECEWRFADRSIRKSLFADGNGLTRARPEKSRDRADWKTWTAWGKGGHRKRGTFWKNCR